MASEVVAVPELPVPPTTLSSPLKRQRPRHSLSTAYRRQAHPRRSRIRRPAASRRPRSRQGQSQPMSNRRSRTPLPISCPTNIPPNTPAPPRRLAGRSPPDRLRRRSRPMRSARVDHCSITGAPEPQPAERIRSERLVGRLVIKPNPDLRRPTQRDCCNPPAIGARRSQAGRYSTSGGNRSLL